MLDQATSDKWNPVFWKELHLMHQNRMLYVMPLIAACLEVLCIIGLSYLRNPLVGDANINFSEEAHCLMFYGVMGVLAMAWVATQIYRVTLQERLVEGLDPQLGTRLTPGKTMLGKCAAVLVCTATISLLEVPFFLFAGNLGVTNWLSFAGLFFTLTAAGCWLVMLGSTPHPNAVRGNLNGAQIVGWLALLPLAGCYLHQAFGISDKIRSVNDSTWQRSLDVIVCAVAMAAFAYCVGLGFLRNSRQERSWSWRLCVLAIWALLPLLLWKMPWLDGEFFEPEWTNVQASTGFLLTILVAAFSAFERLLPSRRTLQQTAGANPVRNVLTLPFRSGLGPGLLLAWVIYLVSCVSATAAGDSANGGRLQAMAAYALLYSPLIALLAERYGFRREAGCGVLAAVSVFLPMFAASLDLDHVACISPFYPLLLEAEQRVVAATVVAMVAVVPGTIALFAYCSKYFGLNARKNDQLTSG